MKTKKLFRTIIIVMVVATLALYLSYQVFKAYYVPVQTETAHTYTVYDKVDTDILVIRSESYVTEEHKGILVNAVENSEKVAMGGDIAYLFETQADAEDFLREKEIDREIDYLMSLQLMSSGVYMVDPDTLDKRINNALYDTLDLMSSGRLENLEETAESLVDLMNRRLIFTDSLEGINDKIRELKTEKESLTAREDLNYTTITADETGYYVNTVDGYESITPFDTVENLMPEDVEQLLSAQPASTPDNCVGKLIGEFEWYIVCNADASYCGEIKIGETITVALPLVDNNEIPAKVVALNKLGEKTALILQCSNMNSEIAALRRETAQIRLKKYEGIRISSKAIRKEGDQTGVYALVGNVIKFRRVNILYESADFAVVEQLDTSLWGNYDYLHLYDEVIVSGKNLFDGKVVD